MSWSSHIATAIADIKSKLTTAGFTVVTNKQIIDGSQENVCAVTVETSNFDDVYEIGAGRSTVNILYRHNNDNDEDTYTALGTIEDVFESYQLSGAVGFKITSISNYYRTRLENKSVAVLSYEIIL